MLIYSQDVKRFFDKVEIHGPNECWIWKAAYSGNGYGEFRVHGRPWHSHRIAWEIYFGAIPPGLCILHHCDNMSCVNPAHLFVGTVAANNHDMMRKGRYARGETKWTGQAYRSRRY